MTSVFRLFIVLIFLWASVSSGAAATRARPLSVAILDFGETGTAQRVTEKLAQMVAGNPELALVDRTYSATASRGIGYKNSLNLALEEARDLGAVLGCDFYLLGDAQSLRRSSSTKPVFYESYASVFIVSARTGRLLKWDRPSFEGPSSADTERLLMAELTARMSGYAGVIREAAEAERSERELSVTQHAPVIEEVPNDASPQASGLRLPQPYRRIRPAYPETAARAEVLATVDVLVDLDTEGEVIRVEIVRWAGFGLDDETVKTIRKMHFRPAMRDGTPIPMRVLLRYNFGGPKKLDAEEPKAEVKKKTD